MKKVYLLIIVLVLVVLANSVIKGNIVMKENEEKNKSTKSTCSLFPLVQWSSISTEQDIKKCLAEGADINERNKDGDTPLHIAARSSLLGLQIVRTSSGKKIDRSIILKIAPRFNRDKVKILLELGADVNIKNNKGETPLVSAFNLEHTKLLLKYGSNPNVQDEDGDTRLHIAALQGNIREIFLLLRYRANPFIKNKYGLTPWNIFWK